MATTDKWAIQARIDRNHHLLMRQRLHQTADRLYLALAERTAQDTIDRLLQEMRQIVEES